MKLSNRVVYSFLIFFLILGYANPIDSFELGNDTLFEKLQNSDTVNLSNFTESEPILIESNSDFMDQGFNGAGTENDPYIIEGLNITDAHSILIKIQNTNANFIIRNCLLDGQDGDTRGISFYQVQNGVIHNNSIHNLQREGISIVLSKFNSISYNVIHDINYSAMRIEYNSNNNTVSNNLYYDNQDGIAIQSSKYNLIKGNEGISNWFSGINLITTEMNIIRDNILSKSFIGGSIKLEPGSNINNYFINNTLIETGILFGAGSNNNFILNNTIFGIENEGFWLLSSSSNTIKFNKLIDCNLGIESSGGGNSDSNSIEYNLIISGPYYGIVMQAGVNSNIIKNNSFAENAGFSQILDNGIANIIADNYYYNWNEITSYPIDGESGNQDMSPRLNPVHLSPIKADFEENGENTLGGMVEFTWNEVKNSFGTEVTYDIYYSSDNGITWKTISNGLNKTEINIDTHIISDGSKVKFKIEGVDDIGFKSVFVFPNTYLIANSEYELSAPEILEPSTQFLQGEITIEWTEAKDNWDLGFTYSLHYFVKGDTSWKEIKSGIVSTSFKWDTTKVLDGEYLIKVTATNINGITAEHTSPITFTIRNGITSLPNTDDLALQNGIFLPLSYMIALLIIRRKKKYH